MTENDPHILQLETTIRRQEATVRRQDKEIESHSRKLTVFEERIGSLEHETKCLAKVNHLLSQLCEELGYGFRTICDHVDLPRPLIMNPKGPFFEPEDIG